MATTLPVTQTINFGGVQIVNATGAVSGESGTAVTGLVNVYTTSANGAIIKSLTVTSSDTAAKIVNLYVYDGSVSWLLGAVSIPAGSGTSSGTTVNVDLLASPYLIGLPLDSSGKSVLALKASHILKVGVQASVSSGKTVSVVALVEEF